MYIIVKGHDIKELTAACIDKENTRKLIHQKKIHVRLQSVLVAPLSGVRCNTHREQRNKKFINKPHVITKLYIFICTVYITVYTLKNTLKTFIYNINCKSLFLQLQVL